MSVIYVGPHQSFPHSNLLTVSILLSRRLFRRLGYHPQSKSRTRNQADHCTQYEARAAAFNIRPSNRSRSTWRCDTPLRSYAGWLSNYSPYQILFFSTTKMNVYELLNPVPVKGERVEPRDVSPKYVLNLEPVKGKSAWAMNTAWRRQSYQTPRLEQLVEIHIWADSTAHEHELPPTLSKSSWKRHRMAGRGEETAFPIVQVVCSPFHSTPCSTKIHPHHSYKEEIWAKIAHFLNCASRDVDSIHWQIDKIEMKRRAHMLSFKSSEEKEGDCSVEQDTPWSEE